LDFLDDLFGGFGPDDGRWVCIAVFDKAVDGVDVDLSGSLLF